MDYMYDTFSGFMFNILDVYYTLSETINRNYNKYFVRDMMYYCYNHNKLYAVAPEGTNHLVIHTNEDIVTRFFGNYVNHTPALKPTNLVVYFGLIDVNDNEIDLTDLLNTFCIPNVSLDFTKEHYAKWINIINHTQKISVGTFHRWSIITSDGDIYELPEFTLTISDESVLTLLPKD